MYLLLKIFGKKMIFIGRDYIGIGTRIKQLASYHICFGLDNTWLFWKTAGWVNKNFDELFRLNEIVNFKSISIKTKKNLPVISYPEKNEFYDRGCWRLYVDDKDVSNNFVSMDGDKAFPSIDFRYNEIPEHVIKKYLVFFEKLTPSSLVLKRIQNVEISDQDVCVHVRNSTDQNDTANVPYITSYFNILNKFPPSTRFFLSAMDKSIANLFYDAYKTRIYELPNKDYSSMIDAVADLYLLGKGKEFVVTWGSSFPEIAWWLGGCRQKVIIVRPSYNQKITVNHEAINPTASQ